MKVLCECGPAILPHDSQPVIRQHSIPGWWQVWSGGICLTLLRPDDVQPIVEAWLAQPPPEHRDAPGKDGEK